MQVDRAADGQLHLLAITSPTEGDAKSQVALAIAVAAAQRGLSVALVDADVRRATLSTHLGLAAEPGLLDLAPVERKRPSPTRAWSGQENSVHPGPVERLVVLPTRADSDRFDHLSRALPDIVLKLQDTYDLVVIDCPSLATDEGTVLLGPLPHVLLAVRIGAPVRQTETACALLAGLRIQVLGLVLTQVTGRKRVTRYAGSAGRGAP